MTTCSCGSQPITPGVISIWLDDVHHRPAPESCERGAL